MKMELRTLGYFLTVAREENITKAAQLLHITQPTLSRQLMQLEEELGVKLFTRSSHSIILTDDGMLLKRRAQEIVSLAEKAKQDFSDTKSLSGVIGIGSGEVLSFELLAEIIAAFQVQHPLVHFDLYSGNADSIKDRMEKGLLDVGLLLEPVDIGKYEFIRIPGDEIWGALVHEDSPLAKHDAIEPQDLLQEKLFVSKREAVQHALANWLNVDHEKLPVAGTFNLLNNAATMAQKQMGVVVTLKLNCVYPHVKFLPFSPRMATNTVLVWKKNQMKAAATEAFLAFAKKYIGGMTRNSI